MKIMRIKEGQIFCKKKCIGNISGRVPTALKLRIPAGKFLRAERCSGCDDIIDVRNAAKVIKAEVSDILFQTVKRGKRTIDELARSLTTKEEKE